MLYTNRTGEYVYSNIGNFTYGSPSLQFWNPKECSIGKFCSIAGNVTIFGGGEHRSDRVSTYPFNFFHNDFPAAKESTGHPHTKGPTVIGNDVWIGTGTTILSGVTVGDGAIIGACSLVTKDVPPYAIVGGNPAKIIKFRFSQDQIDKLLQIKWWDWNLKKIQLYMPLLLNTDIDNFINEALSEKEVS